MDEMIAEIIVKEKEVREQIVQIINNAKLPAVVLQPIFKEFYEITNNLKEQQSVQAENYFKTKEKEEKVKEEDKNE